MADQFPVLFENETIIVRRLDDISRVDDAFVQDLKWPAGRKGQIFAFDNPIPAESFLSPRFTYSKDFSFHLNFSARREWLKGEQPAVSGVRPAATPSLEKHGQLYIKIKRRIFSQLPWVKEDPEEDKRALAAFEGKVDAYKIGYWENGGESAGIIAVRKWKDYMQQPVDWVSWVLVEESLSREDRASTHAYIGAWLKDNVPSRVECVIGSFNTRSHKFFMKLGFKPVALHVYKES